MTDPRTPERRPERVPDLLVERLRLGELPEARAEALRARLAREPGGPERLAELDADDAATLLAHPPATMAAAIEARAGHAPRRASWLRPLAIAVPAAAVAALALMVALPGEGPAPAPTKTPAPGGAQLDQGIRYKGDARLLIYRKDHGGERALDNGAEAAEGDLLQLSYISAGAEHGVVLSIDGSGVVTRHHPESGNRTDLEGGGEVALPHAYELDDAPRFERFFFVTSASPLDVEAVLSAARALARDGDPAVDPLPLGEHLKIDGSSTVDQKAVLLRKVQ